MLTGQVNSPKMGLIGPVVQVDGELSSSGFQATPLALGIISSLAPNFGTRLSFAVSPAGTRSTEQAQIRRHIENGRKVMDVYFKGDQGKPPKSIYHYVDGKAQYAIEGKYKVLGGKWIAVAGRMVVFNAAGEQVTETLFRTDEDRIDQLSQSAARFGVPSGVSPSINNGGIITLRDGAGSDPIVGDEAGCAQICLAAATAATTATTLAYNAAQATISCLGSLDPSACQDAIDWGRQAANAASAAATLAVACKNCLFPPVLATVTVPGSTTGEGEGLASCTDYFLVTYVVATGEVVAEQYLGCF
jgi:hypothetical protein